MGTPTPQSSYSVFKSTEMPLLCLQWQPFFCLPHTNSGCIRRYYHCLSPPFCLLSPPPTTTTPITPRTTPTPPTPPATTTRTTTATTATTRTTRTITITRT